MMALSTGGVDRYPAQCPQCGSRSIIAVGEAYATAPVVGAQELGEMVIRRDTWRDVMVYCSACEARLWESEYERGMTWP
jgi:hypothetical protein